jgi:hypothetical protein
MELASRALFVVASAVLLALAAALMGYGVYQAFEGLGSPGYEVAAKLLDAVGYVVIAIAVFDVAKYLLEEEVVRGRELRHAGEARRSLTKFLSTISIAVFLEALVMVFQAGKERVSDMVYPTLLLLAGAAMVLALGVFQRLSATVERQTGERSPEP